MTTDKLEEKLTLILLFWLALGMVGEAECDQWQHLLCSVSVCVCLFIEPLSKLVILLLWILASPLLFYICNSNIPPC